MQLAGYEISFFMSVAMLWWICMRPRPRVALVSDINQTRIYLTDWPVCAVLHSSTMNAS